MAAAHMGVIGLAVMGQNLALNIQEQGFQVAVYNRTTARTEDFIQGPAAGSGIRACHSLEELVAALQRPRRILLMVQAGKAVDGVLEQLAPLLEPGDILIDGGNSHFRHTERRAATLQASDLLWVGCGISGGEEGARRGPSLMPGGAAEAWPALRPVFEAIAAKVDGQPCCRWIGPGGAGHFVKMVHNGIEYGDMQLIAEAYHLLRDVLQLNVAELGEVFARWNEGPLQSFLIEITARIMAVADDDGLPLIDKILDAAGTKGTGQWTVTAALELGVPLTLIAEAVQARMLSAHIDSRRTAAQHLVSVRPARVLDRRQVMAWVHDALYAAKIVSYAQGFQLLQEASRAYDWSLDLAGIARIWRGGCIIRSRFLDDLAAAYDSDPQLDSPLPTPFFAEALLQAEQGWRQAVRLGIDQHLPLPATGAALTFFDGYRCARLPANLIQAQRDYFGAHTYERVDRPRGRFFHSDWTAQAPRNTNPTGIPGHD
ncbi:decarboxylating NADP(+)-dependent phosphogluconate dehydrogenase [Desulfuromonas sp. CSMB_57]|uniref:decarboxylating NADP(+)-dependent phosphogluconate dehydrogenase n=1 Tax=Desulfuromonas sp. CSMB_57 TaxID=2807629 RepID=UPI0020BF9FB6|nr:decarboxylating NADP(+)-dependent phosphogluconate dehydrogenase [Desulfuromonas sp. CSMB_57]